MRPRPSLLLLLAAIATPNLGAQVPFEHAAIATELNGTPRTGLLYADVQTGTVTATGRFPSDGLAPLEVAIDPLNRNLVVALDDGGATRLVRLALSGASIASERLLAQVPGRVTGLTVAYPGDLYATVGGAAGGLYRIPRNGGTPVLAASLPYATSLTKLSFVDGGFMVTQSAAPGNDPTLIIFDVVGGVIATYPWPQHNTAEITGIIDLPTTLPKQYLVHADGSVSWSLGFQPPMPQVVTPAVPAGGTVAAHSDATNSRFYVLGGASHPFLKTLGLPGYPQTWHNVAGPLPGDPVDFDFEHPTREVSWFFGQGCGSPAPGVWIQGRATPGSTTFGLGVSTLTPTTPAFLVLGASDQQSGGVPLPVTIPGGCQLLVSLDVVLGHTTGGAGGVLQSLPLPNLPGLIGTTLFGQWLVVSGSPFNVTTGVAVRIGT